MKTTRLIDTSSFSDSEWVRQQNRNLRSDAEKKLQKEEWDRMMAAAAAQHEAETLAYVKERNLLPGINYENLNGGYPFRVPDELRGIVAKESRIPAHALDTMHLLNFLSPTNTITGRSFEATEKPTMNRIKIAIQEDAQRTIELSSSVYYTAAKEIVIRQALGIANIAEPYKLAEFKGKLTMDNAAVLQLAQVTFTDLIPAPKQTLEVQELQAGNAVLLSSGWGFVINTSTSKEHPQDVVVRYIELDGTLRVETIAQETYCIAVLAFDASIDGSEPFKKYAFDILTKLAVITNGNTTRALAIYRILDKVKILGEPMVKDMLLANVAEACYRTW